MFYPVLFNLNPCLYFQTHISFLESLNGSWKEGGFVPSSTSSSGYWSWSAPSDQSNPSTPSPPLSADSFKPFRLPSQTDDGIDEAETSSLLFDEPIPRKRKVSLLLFLLKKWGSCAQTKRTKREHKMWHTISQH